MNVEIVRRVSLRNFLATLRDYWNHRQLDTPMAMRLALVERASKVIGRPRPMPRPGAEGRKRRVHVTKNVLKIAGRIPS